MPLKRKPWHGAAALVADNAQHAELANQIAEYDRAVAGQLVSPWVC